MNQSIQDIFDELDKKVRVATDELYRKTADHFQVDEKSLRAMCECYSETEQSGGKVIMILKLRPRSGLCEQIVY